jgi:hypothetical protein
MAKLRTYSLGKACIVLSLLALAGCGANTMMMNSNRMLQTMTVTPPAADGQNFAMGQVQFTAMETFSMPPSPAPVTFVAPFSGGWSVSDMNVATINQSGMAQCMPGARGSVTVMAQASSNSAGPGAMSPMVSASAQLTCP